MEQWIANGAKLAWRIDPFGATIGICSPGAAPSFLTRPDVVEGTGPLESFHLNMARIWAT